jgi:flagellar biosynthesis/type III secretory pathway M-ring protein FliF/YscJ
MSDLKNILSQHNDIDPMLLEKYLKGELSEAQAFEVEQLLDEYDMFEHEAIDGIKTQNPNLNIALLNVNQKIDQTLKLKHKERKQKRKFNANIATLAILMVLALIVIGFVVIKLFLKKG